MDKSITLEMWQLIAMIVATIISGPVAVFVSKLMDTGKTKSAISVDEAITDKTEIETIETYARTLKRLTEDYDAILSKLADVDKQVLQLRDIIKNLESEKTQQEVKIQTLTTENVRLTCDVEKLQAETQLQGQKIVDLEEGIQILTEQLKAAGIPPKFTHRKKREE